ncbi:MAG: DUF4954 family protein [Bacteroidales bacterium]|nr:DUF4954 family protein [Bacteroidales bacterium]
MRRLTESEISTLCSRGCDCNNWQMLSVADTFDPLRFRNVTFVGRVTIRQTIRKIGVADNAQMPSGIYNSTIKDCTIGSNCYINQVALLAGYNVGTGTSITNCGNITSCNSATFGVGTVVSVINEAGGREVPLSTELNSNLAYLLSTHCYRRNMLKGFERLVEAEKVSIRGKSLIGSNCHISNCKTITNVRIGESAIVRNADELTNGTILSDRNMPTKVGNGVSAENFIFAEGAQVTDKATVRNGYVGQCAQVGDGFFAENTLIFANSQLFNGEAVSVLAGPYTVSHHKTTLLIASAVSFFNAGSATNASNHHYKLGPSHQAIFERGVKTGSGSYVLEPALIGAFTMLVGHHSNHPNTSQFPFSYLIERDGVSYLLPAQNLRTIGLFRDEEKWKSRDTRFAELRRDQIVVEALNPMTVGTMLHAADKLDELYHNSDSDVIMYEGTRMKRGLLPRAAKAYRQISEAYIVNGLLTSMEYGYLDQPYTHCDTWIDLGGAIVPKSVVTTIEKDLVANYYQDINHINVELKHVVDEYQVLSSLWCVEMAKKLYGLSPMSFSAGLCNAARKVVAAYTDLQEGMIADAAREYADRMSVGYGLDGTAADRASDFANIKGTLEKNAIIDKCKAFCESKMVIAKRFISKYSI